MLCLAKELLVPLKSSHERAPPSDFLNSSYRRLIASKKVETTVVLYTWLLAALIEESYLRSVRQSRRIRWMIMSRSLVLSACG